MTIDILTAQRTTANIDKCMNHLFPMSYEELERLSSKTDSS